MSSLGKYLLQNKIGSGGQAIIYSAIDQETYTQVALKVLNKEKVIRTLQFEEPENRRELYNTIKKNFTQEYHILRLMLEHKHIINVYHLHEEENNTYFSMQYAHLGSLDKVLDKCKREKANLPLHKKVDILIGITDAVTHLHHNNILHRDIKPGNILLSETYHPYLADLGLGKNLHKNNFIHKHFSALVGTWNYLAPNLISSSKKVNEEADIYALGVTMYALFTLRLPYRKKQNETPEEFQTRIYSSPLPEFESLSNDFIPKPIKDICFNILENKKKSTYKHVGTLLKDLQELRHSNWYQSSYDHVLNSSSIHISDDKCFEQKVNYNVIINNYTERLDKIQANYFFKAQPQNLEVNFFNKYKDLKWLSNEFGAATMRFTSSGDDQFVLKLWESDEVGGKFQIDLSDFQSKCTSYEIINSPYVLNIIKSAIIKTSNTKKISHAYIFTPYINNYNLYHYSHTNTIDKILKICIDAAKGIKSFHDQKITHNNIHPGNILIQKSSNGDIGVLGEFTFPKYDKKKGQQVSIPPQDLYYCFFAPEQFKYNIHQSYTIDLYQFGTTLYYALTKKLPFINSNMMETMFEISSQIPQKPSTYNNLIPKKLDNLCMKLLEKEPEARYASIDHLISHLQLIGKDYGVSNN